MTPTAQPMTHPTILVLLCAFVAAVTLSPSRCLAKIGGFLPSSERGIHIDIQTNGRDL
jgi:hypothetical protein